MSEIPDSVIFHGELDEEDEILKSWVVNMTSEGATSGTQVYYVRRGKGLDKLDLKIGESHEYADWLICKSGNVKASGPIEQLTLNYEGIPEGSEFTQIKVTTSLSEEPIDTHPKFFDFAGRPSDMNIATMRNEDTGAVFTGTDNMTDTFLRFVPKDDDDDGREQDSKVGIQSYLVPQVIWEERRTMGDGFSSSEQSELIGDLGDRYEDVPREIEDPAGDSETLKNFAEEYNTEDHYAHDWLLISCTYEQVGHGGILTRRWKLSGRRGWNRFVYLDGDDSVSSATRGTEDYGEGNDPYDDDDPDRRKDVGEIQLHHDEEPFATDGRYDNTKVFEQTMTWKAMVGTGLELAKNYMTGVHGHPTIDNVVAKSANVSSAEGHEVVTVVFAGVIEESQWQAVMDVSATQEPIDTHPSFKKDEDDGDENAIAGTPDVPKNGAIFNPKTNVFEGFAPYILEDDAPDWWTDTKDSDEDSDEIQNPMAGVTSYLEAGVTWKETKSFNDLNDGLEYLLAAGKYADSPHSGDGDQEQQPPRVKALESGERRNWLNLGGTWEMVSNTAAAGCKVTVEWKLSGNRRWDTDIYEEAE